jgi:hypothetical protein
MTIRFASSRAVILSSEWAVDRLAKALSIADWRIKSISNAFMDRLSIV